MVRNICKSPTFYERGMGVPQFTIGFPNWPIWDDLGTYIFLKPYFGMFGDVYQTLRWQYDNMIWLKQPSLQFTGLSEYSGKTLGGKWRSPGGYLPELRIYNMKEQHKKYEQQWRPQRYLRTHTHALRLQCIQMMYIVHLLNLLQEWINHAALFMKIACFKTNGFAIESGPVSWLGLNFPLMVFFLDPAAHRSCRRHSVFWASCLPASMEDDAMDDLEPVVKLFFLLHMEDVQHDLSSWIFGFHRKLGKYMETP